MIASGARPRRWQRRKGDERRAVIDIGSNTVRLVIYGGPPRAPVVLWNENVAARLGRDLARSGLIPEEAMDEALAALARYALIVRDLGIDAVETVATSAPRDAANGGEFLARVAGLGLEVRLLSGEEEAQASAYGAIGAFPGAEGVVADLGGGSLELMAVAAGACGKGASFPLGTLRLPALRTKDNFDRKIARILTSADWARAAPGPLYLIGGTWRAFATYAMRSEHHPLTDPHGFALTAAAAEKLAGVVERASPATLAQIRGISSMRAEKLPDAAALLRVLLTELAPEELVFSSWGLREGLHVQRLAPAELAKDPLLAGVAAFAGERAASVTDAALLAGWTAAAGGGGRGSERLRLAAAQLALALHRVEPNLRSAHALEWALDKRWIGVDAAGRAMLGAALLGSLGTTAHPERLARLASPAQLREASAWGLALRLAQRLGAGSRPSLAASRLELAAGQLTLQVASSHAALITNPARKDLGALAAWLDLRAQLAPAD